MRMAYICESCGEITSADVVYTCGQCGHGGVRPESNVYICSECGEKDIADLVQTCRKCGGTAEEI